MRNAWKSKIVQRTSLKKFDVAHWCRVATEPLHGRKKFSRPSSSSPSLCDSTTGIYCCGAHAPWRSFQSHCKKKRPGSIVCNFDNAYECNQAILGDYHQSVWAKELVPQSTLCSSRHFSSAILVQNDKFNHNRSFRAQWGIDGVRRGYGSECTDGNGYASGCR
jgi:hypothetical protein